MNPIEDAVSEPAPVPVGCHERRKEKSTWEAGLMQSDRVLRMMPAITECCVGRACRRATIHWENGSPTNPSTLSGPCRNGGGPISDCIVMP
jgi:hypothetical protein